MPEYSCHQNDGWMLFPFLGLWYTNQYRRSQDYCLFQPSFEPSSSLKFKFKHEFYYPISFILKAACYSSLLKKVLHLKTFFLKYELTQLQCYFVSSHQKEPFPFPAQIHLAHLILPSMWNVSITRKAQHFMRDISCYPVFYEPVSVRDWGGGLQTEFHWLKLSPLSSSLISLIRPRAAQTLKLLKQLFTELKLRRHLNMINAHSSELKAHYP